MQKLTIPSKIGLLLASLIWAQGSAEAQQSYTYKIGGTRVQQGSGLARPSDTYITRGTLSPSAQVPVYGSPPQQQRYPQGYLAPQTAQPQAGLPGLPSARMGSTVGMPGDYMRSDLNPNVTFQQQQPQRQNNGYIIMQAPRRANNVYGNSNRPATYGSSAGQYSAGQTGGQSSGSSAPATYSGSGGGDFKGY